jgi:hypothetical protein
MEVAEALVLGRLVMVEQLHLALLELRDGRAPSSGTLDLTASIVSPQGQRREPRRCRKRRGR